MAENKVTQEPVDPAHSNTLGPFIRALGYAMAAHSGRRDKAGDPYIYHCLRVGAALLPDLNAAVVGVLHDILEDTPTAYSAVRDFLVELLPDTGEYAAGALVLLTRKSETPYADYIADIAPHFLARRVKLADVIDNLKPERIGRAIAHGEDPLKMAQLRRRYVEAQSALLNAELSHAV